MKNEQGPTSILSPNNPWKDSNNKIWLASTIKLYRNIEKFNFPAKLATDQQKNIVSLVGDAIAKCPELPNAALYPAEGIEPLEKEYIAEHFLTTEGFYQARVGEAFVIGGDGSFLGTVNIGDHIHLMKLETKNELEKDWNQLVKIDSAINKSLSYAFSQRFGFLTAHPGACGTGLELAVYLQLPTLIHNETIDQVLSELAGEEFTITGLHGNPTEVIGDILVIKNSYTLGVTEEQIISSLETITTKLMMEESSARQAIKANDNPEIKDRVSRAFGILIHSYQIEAVESLNALSLIKLGIEFQWIKGITTKEVNELFFNLRRAHLLRYFDTDIAQEELAHKRAEFIHEKLRDVKLTV